MVGRDDSCSYKWLEWTTIIQARSLANSLDKRRLTTVKMTSSAVVQYRI